MAVAEGLDIPVDKQNPQPSLDAVEEFVNRPEIVEGLDAINEVMLQESPQENAELQQKIVTAVEATKMKTHGLDALVNYARYKYGEGSFIADYI